MNSTKCPSCGLVSFATALQCKRCHAELPFAKVAVGSSVGTPSQPREPDLPTETPSIEPLPEYEAVATPIGGWLIVFAIGLAVSLGLSALNIQKYVGFVQTQTFHDLTTEGSKIYVKMYGSGFTFEFIWQCILGITSILLLIRFFRKSASFPRLAVFILGVHIAVAFIDYLVGLNIERELTDKLVALYGREKVPDLMPRYMSLLVLYTIVSSGAWIAYFLSSRRVESTFIH